MKVNDKSDVIETRPPLGACCVAWSPKGKQMVIGKEDGSMSQFTHTPLIEKKKITSCPLLTEKAKVADVQWLSTYIFLVNYEGLDGNSPPNIYTVHLPEKGWIQTLFPVFKKSEFRWNKV